MFSVSCFFPLLHQIFILSSLCVFGPPVTLNSFTFCYSQIRAFGTDLPSQVSCVPTAFWTQFPLCPVGSSDLTFPKFSSFSFLPVSRSSPYEIAWGQSPWLEQRLPRQLRPLTSCYIPLHLFKLQTLFFVCNCAKTLYLPPFCPCSVFL